MIRRQLLTGLLMTVALTGLLGLAYPLAVTGISQIAFHDNANGSLVKDKTGTVVGSSLLGQGFLDVDGNPIGKYFQPRPSAAGAGYDPRASSATNLGPGNPKLIAPADGPDCFLVDRTDDAGAGVIDAAGNPIQECYGDTVPARIATYRQLNGLQGDQRVPVDAVTASASGLDPGISVANAMLQAGRVTRERGLTQVQVLEAIAEHTQGRQWGFLGEKWVNVLGLNLALDAMS